MASNSFEQKNQGRITQASIERVLERADLVEIVSGYTELSNRGAEHVGRCPFHEERSPSFWVNGTKGVYHCFGCGASGDVIRFQQEKRGLDFVEAIEDLADRYRIELEYEGASGRPTRRVSKRRLFELTEAASAFYEAMLLRSKEAEPTRAYLQERLISASAVEAFRIGYSPEDGKVLSRKAIERGFSNTDLKEARLQTSAGKDFFRGRLMIPIIDRAGRVQGFGARKLRDDQFGGKYVNSADGPLFHKKQTIFLAPDIVAAARQAGQVVVVEGYMDVIALWQAGIRNVCAVMGTALTEQQVMELKRLAPRALFAFDPDTAGHIATLRALEQADAHDLDVRVVLLPEGNDPADVLAEANGLERMEQLLSGGVTLLQYRVNTLLGSGDLGDASARERIYRDAVTLFASIPDGPARREQIARVGNVLQLDSDSLELLYAKTGAAEPMRLTRKNSSEPQFREQRAVRARIAGSGARSTALMREKRLLAAALRLAEAHGASAPVKALMPPLTALTLDVHRRAYERLFDAGVQAFTPANVRDDDELMQLVAELATILEKDMLTAEDDAQLEATVKDLASAVELQYIERRAGELSAQLGDSDTDEESLLTELAAINARRNELLHARRG